MNSINYIKNIINSSAHDLHGKTVDYLSAAKEVYGHEKVSEVCSRYSLFLRHEKRPLNSHHVRQLQVGLNDINASDLDAFLNRIHTPSKLCKRDIAALEKIGEGTVKELKQYAKASLLPPTLFNKLIEALQVPNEEYANTTFTHDIDPSLVLGVPGRMFSKEHFLYGFIKQGRSLEDEERMRLYEELANLGPDDQSLYSEILTKIIVKKHLFYEDKATNELRMGMLIPAPRGKDGEARWYRVDDILDSGLGKFAYRLVPATQEYADDMPDLLLYRNSSPLPTAMDAFTCFLSDINILPPGYLSKNSCVQKEMSWLNQSSPSPNRPARPLLITGHSLGSSNAQLALVNMQQSGQWPNRSITLELFDSPAILRKDAQNFASWIKNSNIETPLVFNYYVSHGDPVPFAGSLAGSSYLGRGLPHSNVRKMRLTEAGMRKPGLTGQGPHGRIFYRGKPGIDYTNVTLTIEQYDAEVRDERITVNSARVFSTILVWGILAPIGGLKRFFFGRRFHDPIIVKIFRKNRENLHDAFSRLNAKAVDLCGKIFDKRYLIEVER